MLILHSSGPQRAWEGRRETWLRKTCKQVLPMHAHPLGCQRRQQLGDARHVAGVGGGQAARPVQQRWHQGLPGSQHVPCQQRRCEGGSTRCSVGVRLLTPRQLPPAAPKCHLGHAITGFVEWASPSDATATLQTDC